MANTQGMCVSYKSELMQALHNHTNTTGNVFKVALYTSTATLSKATTAYSATNEITNTAGVAYVAGGFAWTAAQNTTPAAGTTGCYTTWSVNPAWTVATFTANAALIYNSSASNKAVAVLTFGGDQTVTAGTFTLTLPSNSEGSAILQIN